MFFKVYIAIEFLLRNLVTWDWLQAIYNLLPVNIFLPLYLTSFVYPLVHLWSNPRLLPVLNSVSEQEFKKT